jgi:hypothetical protein
MNFRMKNFRKLRTGLICLLVGVLATTSCVKDGVNPFQGIGDVAIQDIKTDAGVKYAIVAYVTANQEIQSAKVTVPGTNGRVYQLSATSTAEQFSFIPQASDYTSEIPISGNYSIEVTSLLGETLTGKDVVGSEKLSPIIISAATVDSQKLKVTWDKVTDAETYVVKIYSADKSELLFASNFLLSSDVQFEIEATTQGWHTGKSPVANTNYVVELLGICSEADASSDKVNNLQFITTDSKTIKWQ